MTDITTDARSLPIEPDPDPSAPARQGIQSVEIAVEVIAALEAGQGPMSLGQIAAASGMSASKAHRYLVSLCRTGLVSQASRSGLYDFGPAMRRLGTESLRRMDEVGIASEYLPRLRDRTTHSTNLAVWGDAGPVIVHWEYGAHALPINVRVGATLPLLDSSVGRVFLTYLPSAMTRPVLEFQTGDAEGAAGRVAEARAQVTSRGVAVTSGGVLPGLASIAAPVFPARELPLAVSVAVPARLADETSLSRVEQALRETAGAMTVALGGAAERA